MPAHAAIALALLGSERALNLPITSEQSKSVFITKASLRVSFAEVHPLICILS
jgi:hypothetical protein